jgi:NAD(P)-dependent dehydrogenase (short-subunit alcohol dehydrogenase family)
MQEILDVRPDATASGATAARSRRGRSRVPDPLHLARGQREGAFVGRPEDVAAVIAYLASDDAAFVQGAAVRADGGRLDRL